MEATLADVIHRGTNVDHVLETADGQRLTAASTRQEVEGVGRVTAVAGWSVLASSATPARLGSPRTQTPDV